MVEKVLVPFDIGVVYICDGIPMSEKHYVLVPFDIGVVYIFNIIQTETLDCFSPLRYWGGLYQ